MKTQNKNLFDSSQTNHIKSNLHFVPWYSSAHHDEEGSFPRFSITGMQSAVGRLIEERLWVLLLRHDVSQLNVAQTINWNCETIPRIAELPISPFPPPVSFLISVKLSIPFTWLSFNGGWWYSKASLKRHNKDKVRTRRAKLSTAHRSSSSFKPGFHYNRTKEFIETKFIML